MSESLFIALHRPCVDCGKPMTIWIYNGSFSHIGGENTEHAKPVPEGGYCCTKCGYERWQARVVLYRLDNLVNGHVGG